MATEYVIKGIQEELQNVTSKNDATMRHAVYRNMNTDYYKSNTGIFKNIGNALSGTITGTSVRISTGAGTIYGRDFEVTANTSVEVPQNTNGYVIVKYDENKAPTQRFSLTTILRTDTIIKQDLLNSGKQYMFPLFEYTATAQVDSLDALDTVDLSFGYMQNALNNKVDKTTMGNYVQRRTTGTNLNVNMGQWQGNSAYPFFVQSYINSSNENTVRLLQTFPEGDTGLYVTPSFVNHISNGTAKTLAYKTDLNDKVSKAIGTASKSVTIGEVSAGGEVDFQIYHDNAKGNLMVRRMSGADYHGFYSNEDDQHMYVYLGNNADARKIANSVDLLDYVQKDNNGDNSYIKLADYNGGTTAPFYINAYINNASKNTTKLVNTFPKGEQGFYAQEGDFYHVDRGTSKRLAYTSELSDKVSKAIGTGSKSVTIGELSSGGQVDFQIYHDMNAQNLAVRRISGDDYHGFYSNENDQHLYVYLGNKSDARKIANSVDLENYVLKDSDGVSSYIKFADYNGGTTTPFFVQAYVNSANKNTVKLANTFANGEQGIYVQEGSLSHIDRGASHELAYTSDVLPLTGGNLTGLLTSDHNINTTANINAAFIATSNGRFTANGTAEGLKHVGTGSTSAQDTLQTLYPDGSRRMLLRTDTSSAQRLYLTNYASGSSGYTGGIVCQNDYVMHVFDSGNKIIGLAHLTDLTRMLTPMAEVVELQNEILTELATDQNVSKSLSTKLTKLKSVGTSLTDKLKTIEEELEKTSQELIKEFSEES